MTISGLLNEFWQKPAPLEGVKSRKRLVFEVPSVYCKTSNSASSVARFSNLKVSLESRIAAVGEVGRASIDLLLGKRHPITGSIVRHDDLRVVHLGPHLLDKGGQSVEQYLAAAVVALELRPQLVIIDEAVAARNEAWERTFNALLDSEMLQAFHGALVICTSEETTRIKQVCSQRWTGAGSWLWQEEIKDDDDLEFVEDILSMRGQEALLEEVSDLAWQKPFLEDIIAQAKAKGWLLTVLTTSSTLGLAEGSEQDKLQQDEESTSARHLAGFICYSIFPGNKFYITRVAVPQAFRKAGHGRRLMRWALDKTARMPRSEIPWLALFSLDEAVPFYENFGFVDMTLDEVDADGHFQTYMELRNESIVPESSEE